MLKRIIVKGPALSSSGYGEQTRFALRALKAHEDKFDIFLVNIAWGKTGWILPDHPEREWIDTLLTKTHVYVSQGGQFDISLQVTIPNEFEKMAPVNIGYTAGIETTKIAPHWIEKSKIMDKIIVVSNHAKFGFDNTVYQAQNQSTGETFPFVNETPVEVVNYCVRDIVKQDISDKLKLTTDFNFLSVAQWGNRKNIEATIVNFVEEFANDEDVGLVLKVSTAKSNVKDRILCDARLNSILRNYPERKCKVYMLHGNMDESEMAGLYTHPKIKAIVSTSHGEGFGLPLFEAAANGLPVLAPNWSGQTDFLYAPKKDKKGKIRSRAHFTKIDYDLGQVQKKAVWEGVVQADSMWCFVKNSSVKNALREVYKNHGPALSTAKQLKKHILKEFTPEKKYSEFVNCIFSDKEVKMMEEIDSMFEELNA